MTKSILANGAWTDITFPLADPTLVKPKVPAPALTVSVDSADGVRNA